MNVSMMDSFNLSWKLVHSINGLSPQHVQNLDPLLATFSTERLTIAKQLIDFDTKFSSMFSGKIGSIETEVDGLTHEEFLKIFVDGSGFTSGCGIEYPEGRLVRRTSQVTSLSAPLITGSDFLSGNLKAGRRLNDCVVTRYADANPRNVQDGASYLLRLVKAPNSLTKS